MSEAQKTFGSSQQASSTQVPALHWPLAQAHSLGQAPDSVSRKNLVAVEKHMESSAFGHVKGVGPSNEEVTPNPGWVDGLEVGGWEVEPETWGMGGSG